MLSWSNYPKFYSRALGGSILDIERWGCLLFLFGVVVAAIFATGYHHPDEYMQIIEFANYKLAGRLPEDMSWEFHETMRPWFQPSLFYLVVSGMRAVGRGNPFLQISVFRLFLGLLGLLAVDRQKRWLVGECGEAEGQNFYERRMACLLCYGMFFLPWLFTRTSSESLSASLFMISSLACLQLIKSGKPLRIGYHGLALTGVGFSLGLAFLSRFQIAFSILGLGLWCLLIARVRWSFLLVMSSGFLAAVALGCVLDYWGYGQWQLTPYHYFVQNIILGKASQWGTKPFLAYLWMMQSHGFAPLSLLISGAVAITCLAFPKNPLTWITVPFVVGHSLVGHKEMRFLFPIAVWAPSFLWFCFQAAGEGHSRLSRVARYIKTGWLSPPAIVFQMISLLFLCVWPSRTEVLAQQKIAREGIQELQYVGKSPYELGGNPVSFVRPPGLLFEEMTVAKASDPRGSTVLVSTPEQRRLLVLNQQSESITNQLSKLEICEPIWQVFPSWLEKYNTGDWMGKAGAWALLKCRPRPHEDSH